MTRGQQRNEHTRQRKSLEERFDTFLRGLHGAESIDDLPLTQEQQQSSRADFFLLARSIIVEVKAAENDMQRKIASVLEPFTSMPDWPMFAGSADISPYLKNHPRGPEIRARMYNAATTALANRFESANRQIRSTKRTFNIPHSGGLMIYLNDCSEIVNPQVMAHCVSHLLCKRNEDGSARHPDIDAVLLISDTHVVVDHQSEYGLVILVGGDQNRWPPRFGQSCEDLISQWAKHNGFPLAWGDGVKLDALSEFMRPRRELDELKRFPATRNDVLAREYRRARQYEYLDRNALFHLGAEAHIQFLSHVLKGSRARLGPAERADCNTRLIHFHEEMKLRGIDMKVWFEACARHIDVAARERAYATDECSDS